MAIIRVKDNHSIQLALKYVTAKESPRNGRMEYLYTLEPKGDGLFVSPQGHAEIQSLKLSAGEPFTLSKLVGETNTVTWAVERIPQSNPAPKAVVSARSITDDSIPVPPSLTTPQSRRIFQQVCAVILAVKAAEDFGETIGRPTHFESADIRAMAISGFIDEQGRARRVA